MKTLIEVKSVSKEYKMGNQVVKAANKLKNIDMVEALKKERE